MATKQQLQQLHHDLGALLNKDVHAHLSSTHLAIIRQLAEELQQADPQNTAAKLVLSQVPPGSRLEVSDGLALVGQLSASLGMYD